MPQIPPAKSSTPTPEQELSAAVQASMGPLFDIGDNVAIATLSGGNYLGIVEDANLVGLLVRTADDRLFFVAYTSMDNAEILDGPDGGDGEDADEDLVDAEAAPAPPPTAADDGSDVVPIRTARTEAA